MNTIATAPEHADDVDPSKPGEQKDPTQEVDQADEGLIPTGDPDEGK